VANPAASATKAPKMRKRRPRLCAAKKHAWNEEQRDRCRLAHAAAAVRAAIDAEMSVKGRR
jgi:ribosomal protein S30